MVSDPDLPTTVFETRDLHVITTVNQMYMVLHVTTHRVLPKTTQTLQKPLTEQTKQWHYPHLTVFIVYIQHLDKQPVQGISDHDQDLLEPVRPVVEHQWQVRWDIVLGRVCSSFPQVDFSDGRKGVSRLVEHTLPFNVLCCVHRSRCVRVYQGDMCGISHDVFPSWQPRGFFGLIILGTCYKSNKICYRNRLEPTTVRPSTD